MATNRTFRKFYDRLSPFERAALNMGNAFGKRSRGFADAAAPTSFFDSYWVSHWDHAMHVVAGFAVFQALLALLHMEIMKDGRLALESLKFMWALERLEKETGAPLSKCEMIYGFGVFTYTKWLFKEAGLLEEVESKGLDYSEEYACLRGVWDVFTEKVNQEDAWRRLPPVGKSPMRKTVRRIGKTVEGCTEGAPTDRAASERAQVVVIEPKDLADIEELEELMNEAYREEERAKDGAPPPSSRGKSAKRRKRKEPLDEDEERDVPGAASLVPTPAPETPGERRAKGGGACAPSPSRGKE